MVGGGGLLGTFNQNNKGMLKASNWEIIIDFR